MVFQISNGRATEIARPSEYENKPVVAIRFEPSTQPVSQADLQRLFPLKPGHPLTLTAVRNAIKVLYATGRYANIAIEGEPSAAGWNLVIRTTDQMFVGPVNIRGKLGLPPNRGQLASATRLELGAPFDDQDLQTATKNIEDLLERNGLYRATIQPHLEQDSEHQQVLLTFLIHAGKRARLDEPAITGTPGMPVEKVAKAAKYKGWFRWKPATEENTNHGVTNVLQKYEKQDRLTASASLAGRQYEPEKNRVKPTLDVAGGPKVKIRASGAKVSKGKLKEYVPVFDEQTVNRDLLVLGARNLRDYFQSKGYFEVQVDFRTTNPGPDQEEITYTIEPGERHKLVRVDVQGNKFFETKEIRERMFLEPSGFIRLRHGRYSEGFVRRDEDAIKALYQSNGFRDVNVTITPVDDYQGKKGEVAATVNITEGPQYVVSNVTVNGLTRIDRNRIVPSLASAPGEPFSETNVALDRDYIILQYQSLGYPDAQFDWKMTPGPGPHEIAVEYNVAEGQPRFVRDVLLSGMHTTRRRLVDPNILLHPGDPLSWTQMGRMQRRLYNLGVFDKVDMAVQNQQGTTQNKYVLYNLEEGHRYYVGVGAGAEIARIGGSQNSLDNPGGQTGFSPRASFEVSRLNLWGLGHSLNFKSRYSSLERRALLNYSAPRYRNVDGRNISVTALYDNTRDVRTFTATRIEGSAQLSQKLSKPTTALFRYTWRDSLVDQKTLKIDPALIPLLAQTAHVGMLSASLIEDRRDDPANAHRGIYNTLDFGVAETYLGGNKNFARFLARNAYYKTLKSVYVLASNTEFGWIAPFNVTAGQTNSVYIPLPERFFGGGSTSHRGFPDNQAGPRDSETGFPLGGNSLLFHSTELRFPLIGSNIGGVLFHDMGNVYSGVSNISFRVHQKDVTDFDYMVHAVGFGIRYRTPVGPVRLDLAYSINPPSFYGLKGSYEQLVFGGATKTYQNVSHFQFFFSIGQAF